MRPVDLIRKKRDGGEHSRDEIATLVNGYTRGDIPDYQMSAWLMAVVVRGMTREEIRADFPEITDEDIQAALAFAADFTNGGWRMSAAADAAPSRGS